MNNIESLKCDIVRTRSSAKLPKQAHSGEDAGWDLWTVDRTVIKPNRWTYVPTGLILAPEPPWWYEVVPRSSTEDMGVEVCRSIMDNGFRGELTICVRPLCKNTIIIDEGIRLAQLIFHRIPIVIWNEVEIGQLPVSRREDRGFGSSGTN